jgi:anti-sigma regulatory factor (Ser/Thr protein kinase)
MSLKLLSIDFSAGHVFANVENLSQRETDERVRNFLQACATVGLREITLQTPEGDSAQLSCFGDLAKSLKIKIYTATLGESPAPTAKDGPQSYVASAADGQAGNDGELTYSLSLPAREKHLRLVSQFAVLCSRSTSSNSRIESRLRLTLHELAANSMEHARYRTPDPTVEIRIVFREGSVGVFFSDNAEPFSPEQRALVKIADKIRRSESRGLGLTLIKSLVSDLKYERQSGWNRLSYTIDDRLPAMAQSEEDAES